MGALATHLSNLPSWFSVTIDLDEFDMAPGGQQIKAPECRTRQELLDTFAVNVTGTGSLSDD
jgi:hypothetical protein